MISCIVIRKQRIKNAHTFLLYSADREVVSHSYSVSQQVSLAGFLLEKTVSFFRAKAIAIKIKTQTGSKSRIDSWGIFKIADNPIQDNSNRNELHKKAYFFTFFIFLYFSVQCVFACELAASNVL